VIAKVINTKHILFILIITVFFPLLIFLKGSGYNPYSISEVLIVILLILYSAYVIQLQSNTQMPGIYLLILIMYIFYQMMLVFVSGSFLAAFSSLLLHNKFIIVSILVFYLINNKNEDLLLKFILLVATASAYLGLIKVIQDPSLLLELYKSRGGFRRIESIFPNPNMYGSYMLTASFLGLYFLEVIIKRKNKILFIFFVYFPILLSLLLTFSRRAWGLFVFGMIVYFLFKKGKKIFFVISFICVTALFFQYIDYDNILNRFLLIFDPNYESNFKRMEGFLEHLPVINNSIYSLLAGSGLGMFGPNIMFTELGRWREIHNYYVQVTLEMGFIGLILYMLIFILVIAYCIKLLKNINGQRVKYNKILIYLIILLCLYAIAFVGSTPITFPTNLLQWLIIGLILKNYSLSLGTVRLRRLPPFNDQNFLIPDKRKEC
jgi:O-antigen ligase